MRCVENPTALAARNFWKVAVKYRLEGAMPPHPTRNHVMCIVGNPDPPDSLRDSATQLATQINEQLTRMST